MPGLKNMFRALPATARRLWRVTVAFAVHAAPLKWSIDPSSPTAHTLSAAWR